MRLHTSEKGVLPVFPQQTCDLVEWEELSHAPIFLEFSQLKHLPNSGTLVELTAQGLPIQSSSHPSGM